MSSPDFQTALARLIASPAICESFIEENELFFSEYQLNEREKKRLRSVVRQKGMSACCSLYRMNRVTPVYTQLLHTSTLLDDQFVPLVEAFWNSYTDTSLQFREEVMAFGNYLMGKIQNGDIKTSYLKEILQLEMAVNELNYLPQGEVRFLQFEYNIGSILYYLNVGNLEGIAIDPATETYKIYLKDNQIQVDVV